MASNELCAKVRFYASKNNLDPENYTNEKIARREREARKQGITYAEFARMLLSEVQVQPSQNQRGNFGLSKCPQCGGMTLIHEDGCMHCKSCGWSACG